MSESLVILAEDRRWLEHRIAQLEKSIKDLGPEFHEVLNQSSETWHDNAPFDAVREKQDLLVAERSQLHDILTTASLQQAPNQTDRVDVGSHVLLQAKDKEQHILIAGDWSYRSGKTIDGILVVSRQSPLAQALIGKTNSTETQFGTITSIS